MDRWPAPSLRERARWTSCGLIAGLILGITLGWMFHGLVGAVIKTAIVLLLLMPFVAAVVFWWSSSRQRTASRPYAEVDTIQEASWRDIGSPPRDRRP
jgi:F0F1-type ATP synthase assembly protein I